MRKLKRPSTPKLYPIRHQLLISKEQYRKLSELANAMKCSMGAVLRFLLDEAKINQLGG
jgi:hypothetical protein